jgi:hypothetical protein
LNTLAVRLDALKSLDVDALILPAPTLPAPGSNDPLPSLDDIDNLTREASRHGIRVLLTLHAQSATADLSGLARFWLNRGVAGLHIATATGTSQEQTESIVQAVRKQASGALGQRIIVTDLDLAPATADQPNSKYTRRTARPSVAPIAQLQIDNRAASLPTISAAALRPLLAQNTAQPNQVLDLSTPGSSPQLAEAVATMALVTQPAALIDSAANLVLEPTIEQPKVAAEEPAKPASAPPPQPPPGTYLPYVPYVPPPKPKPVEAPRPKSVDPLTNWYRQLAALHHDNTVLRTGSPIFLDFDAQNALVWVTKPAKANVLTPPVVVVCNLSSAPVQLSLTEAMKKLDLHGFFLRKLLRSDQGMGAQDLDAVTVPAFGVYIGELRR